MLVAPSQGAFINVRTTVQSFRELEAAWFEFGRALYDHFLAGL